MFLFFPLAAGHYIFHLLVLGSWCITLILFVSAWCLCVCCSQRIEDCWSPSLVFNSAHASLSIAMGLFICIKCSCFNKALFVWRPTHTFMESASSHLWFASIVLKSLSQDYIRVHCLGLRADRARFSIVLFQGIYLQWAVDEREKQNLFLTLTLY